MALLNGGGVKKIFYLDSKNLCNHKRIPIIMEFMNKYTLIFIYHKNPKLEQTIFYINLN